MSWFGYPSVGFLVTSPLEFKARVDTARNLYQLNANEIPLTLHYGFEGYIYYFAQKGNISMKTIKTFPEQVLKERTDEALINKCRKS